ncbi:hypothetical protein MAR_024968 [Mya arenaria]|uniref:Uncharacterized protein n=1 Tax=Mya arenaria TaxID=6604 RepID=A0ABY7E0A7_MYAAR|nr:hypothetical protein MAR_024968 [Mya arenaria]
MPRPKGEYMIPWYITAECGHAETRSLRYALHILQDKEKNALNLSNVSGIFHILIGGLVLSMIISLTQILFKSKIKRRTYADIYRVNKTNDSEVTIRAPAKRVTIETPSSPVITFTTSNGGGYLYEARTDLDHDSTFRVRDPNYRKIRRVFKSKVERHIRQSRIRITSCTVGDADFVPAVQPRHSFPDLSVIGFPWTGLWALEIPSSVVKVVHCIVGDGCVPCECHITVTKVNPLVGSVGVVFFVAGRDRTTAYLNTDCCCTSSSPGHFLSRRPRTERESGSDPRGAGGEGWCTCDPSGTVQPRTTPNTTPRNPTLSTPQPLVIYNTSTWTGLPRTRACLHTVPGTIDPAVSGGRFGARPRPRIVTLSTRDITSRPTRPATPLAIDSKKCTETEITETAERAADNLGVTSNREFTRAQSNVSSSLHDVAMKAKLKTFKGKVCLLVTPVQRFRLHSSSEQHWKHPVSPRLPTNPDGIHCCSQHTTSLVCMVVLESTIAFDFEKYNNA